jgi:leader peptidase (prepilin peptidase) / N-methyltransferase
MLVWGWLAVLFGWLFITGSAVGSFLNVCIYRLPRGRNLFWPSSRCGACFAPIRATDNLPLVAYWRLGGRCRTCGARFSVRYFLVELIVGLVFAGLYALEIGANIHGFDVWTFGGFSSLEAGQFPPDSWTFFVGHAVLASALVVAIGCLLDGEEVPRGLVVFGAACGLAWALMFPWPTPTPYPTVTRMSSGWTQDSPRPGFVPWPVWEPGSHEVKRGQEPPPQVVERGSFEMGLLSAAAGILVPAGLVRLVDRRRRLGSAAGILMMTGGFLGWQPLVVALAFATVLALGVSTRRRITGGLFAFLLALYLIVAWLGWAWLGPIVWPVLSDVGYLAVFVAVLVAGLVVVGKRSGIE